MRLFSFILFIALLIPTAFGQSRASRCYFGNCIINFDYLPFQMEAINLPTSGESAASICDENGQLLFYSNGGPHNVNIGGIWNYNNQFIENGNILDSAGCWSTYAGASIIPVPNVNRINTGQYYLFTKDCWESSFSGDNHNAGLTVALINMNANNGLGTVVSKYTSLIPYEYDVVHSFNVEAIALINQSNGTDYWLFSYSIDSLCRIPVTAAGIGQPEKLFKAGGNMLFSPDANFAVLGDKLYNFDAATGNFTFNDTIPYDPGQASVAFSSDGHFLYTLNNQRVTQYDCTASDIFATGYIVSNDVGGNAQIIFLAPNTRIFICGDAKNYLEAQIVCPNNGGAACGFDGTDLPLNGGITGYNRFTNIPANFLYREVTSCSLNTDEQELSGVLVHTTETDFIITGEALGNLSVTMIDLQGKIVGQQHGIDHVTINRTTLQAGVYVLIVTATTGKTRRFLVVNH